MGLDGLRAIAFLMVFVSHKLPSGQTEAAGSAGVWLFFVLSGFLISQILLRERALIRAGADSPSACLARFYVNRAARILPAYFALLLVVTLLARAHLTELHEPERQLANWLLLSNVYIEQHGWRGHLGHLWSLAVELQYYLVAGLLTLATIRFRISTLALLAIAASLLAHGAFWALGASRIHFDVNAILNFSLFAAGTMAALGMESPLPRWLRSTAAMAVVLALYVTLPFVIAPADLYMETGRASCLLSMLLLVQIAQGQDTLFVRCLEARWIRGIGVVSFGAYLFHPVLGAEHVFGSHRFWAGRSIAEKALADLGLVLVLAAVSFRFYERPIRIWCRNRCASSRTDSGTPRSSSADGLEPVVRRP